jgi:hypothetical protein
VKNVKKLQLVENHVIARIFYFVHFLNLWWGKISATAFLRARLKIFQSFKKEKYHLFEYFSIEML